MTVHEPLRSRRVPADALPGLLLIAAAAVAVVAANSPLAPGYAAMLAMRIGPLDLRDWIGEALMALFFFHVGLEVKREAVAGALASPAARRVPVVAAACGMAVPAAVYCAVGGGVPGLARGWAIASATDIAFALGVLTLLGRRVPGSLRLLLTTIAVADDIGAVAIIAFGYTRTIAWGPLAAAAVLLLALAALNRLRIRSAWPYLVSTVALWVAVHASGVHPTVAGVAGALFVPADRDGAPGRLEHAIAPWVAFGVLPLFALANAGVPLGGARLSAPLPLAVMLGLFLGKQVGVFGAVRAMAALGLGARPAGATWMQVYGMALLTGIGFTMSLFIAGLAFDDAATVDGARLGILAGSLLSGIAGFAVLRCTSLTGPGAGSTATRKTGNPSCVS